MEEPTKESSDKLFPVILSGGSGKRLWPLSRECFPKQYLKLDNESKFSLLQNTFLRIIGLDNLSSPLIICNEEQRFIVAEQMRELNINPHSILLEPFGKNTAPAIALASLLLIKESPDAKLLILSADHEIKDSKKFKNMINKGCKFAEEGQLVTFGIKPNAAETGYGYIESYKELSQTNYSSKIKSFVEKPSKNLATNFIRDKHFSWNSGIFLFKASIIINELKKFEPKLLSLCEKCINECEFDRDFIRIKEKYFNKCPNIPIDKAIMEKTNIGTVLSLDIGWSDIGSWKTVWENSKKDSTGNSCEGNIIIKKTENCYLRSENRLIVGIGIKNLIVVETHDAILILEKESSQDIKNLVAELNEIGLSEAKTNKKIYRPWGHFTSVIEDKTWQVKKLEIKPKSSLSLQKHHHRSEHWVVVDGRAKVEIEDKITFLNKNQSIYVPLGAKHRLSNLEEIPLIIIEVQSGDYLGEDDIIRFDDNYGRSIN